MYSVSQQLHENQIIKRYSYVYQFVRLLIQEYKDDKWIWELRKKKKNEKVLSHMKKHRIWKRDEETEIKGKNNFI